MTAPKGYIERLFEDIPKYSEALKHAEKLRRKGWKCKIYAGYYKDGTRFYEVLAWKVR